MNKHTVYLSDKLETFLQKIIQEHGFSDASEYISELIDLDRSKKLSKEPTSIEKLKLFNRKAKRLEESNFWQWFGDNKLQLNYNWGVSHSFQSPEQESLEAFLLTFRLFQQNNDYISIKNIKKVYHAIDIPEEYKNQFSQIRNYLNQYLNKPSPIQGYSNKEILKSFIYGELAHFTQREDYENLHISEFGGLYSDFQFIDIVINNTGFILRIKHLNEKVIEHLENS